MDRKVFKLPIRSKGVTHLPCPYCESGVLQVIEGQFNYKETAESKRAHADEAWEPEWITYVFGCLLECRNCKDVVSCSGTGSVEQYMFYDHEDEPGLDYSDFFIPKFFSPNLKIFAIPENTPGNVVHELNKSFNLFFADPASAANHVRVALEHLLTHLKIKRFTSSKGRRNILALHKRIELLPKKYEHIQDILFAIKWLGNAGSHNQHEITTDDVLDSYELMVELLTEIFANRRTRAKSLAKKINKKKGPL